MKRASDDLLPSGSQRKPAQILVITVGLVFAATVMGVAVGFSQIKGISVANLTRDPAAVLQGPAYIGFASNVGAVLWIMAGAGALFVGHLASGLGWTNRGFLYSAGALSLLLGVDDLFMLHEDILPRLGVPQTAILLTYAGLAAAFAVRYRREILAGSPLLFTLAALFLGASLVTDLFVPYSEAEAAMEDGAKLFGITFWFLFVAREVVAPARQGTR